LIPVACLPGAPDLQGVPHVEDVASAREQGVELVLGRVDDRLSLWAPARKAAPLCVDFLGGRQGYRLAADRVRHERLIKALGKVVDAPARVCDLTAGLGRDSALMAQAGFQVLMVERQPILHALLADGLARATGTPLASHLTLLPLADARDLAAVLEGPFHAVFLDPMFPPRDKSAAVKQDLRWLQQLCPYPDEVEEQALLAMARSLDARKVVVKRPRRAPPLAAVVASHSLEGKTVRFDVYTSPSVRK
jgi:16S rRNA (guanine1516-N2)-methyltransferase